jgi:CxxC-x17-CxxC domain-containing protein
MKEYKKSSGFKGGAKSSFGFGEKKSFGKKPFSSGSRDGGFRGGFGGAPTLHKAVCDECGKSCEVPFRPTGEKPVFCNDCFSAKRGGDSYQKKEYVSTPRASQGGDLAEIKSQLLQLEAKIDLLLLKNK